MDQKNGGSISFGDNSFTTKQCTGYVPHKPSYYDVEHVGKIQDNIKDKDSRIGESTYHVHGLVFQNYTLVTQRIKYNIFVLDKKNNNYILLDIWEVGIVTSYQKLN